MGHEHYFLDGYNLLFFIYGKSHEPIHILRKKLITLLVNSSRNSSRKVSFTLVFDAHKRSCPFLEEEEEEKKTHIAHVEVIYTSIHRSADHFLYNSFLTLSNLPRSSKKKNSHKKVILITSDNALGNSISALGFTWMRVPLFFDLLVTQLYTRKKEKRGKKASDSHILQREKKSTEKEYTHPSFSEQDLSQLSFDLISTLSAQKQPQEILPNIGDIQSWQNLFEAKLQEYNDEI